MEADTAHMNQISQLTDQIECFLDQVQAVQVEVGDSVSCLFDSVEKKLNHKIQLFLSGHLIGQVSKLKVIDRSQMTIRMQSENSWQFPSD